MNATPRQATMKKTVQMIRWIARTISTLILLVWGYFIVAHLIDDAAQFRRLTPNDSAQLGMMMPWLASLAVAWRWELAGSTGALAVGLIGALLNPNGAILALIPATPALLFLFCWRMSRPSRHTP